mgnify:FL=1
MGYALIRTLVRLLLAVFYRRIEVVGAERIPQSGALIVAANHHNSVVDAMILMAIAPRRLRPLANAPLFSHPLIGPLLRLAGALPVPRRQEAGDDPRRNDALFAATTATLQDGGAIMIFPEGKTQPEPVLQALRTGTARMLLAAQHAAGPCTPVTLLPVGLVFERPGVFREGSAVVMVGAPVSSDDLPAGDEPRALTARLETALRTLIVEAPDRDILCHAGVVAALSVPSASSDSAAGERLARQRAAMAGYRWLAAHQPQRLSAFAARLRSFALDMDKAGLPCAAMPRRYSLRNVATFMLRTALPMALAAPLAWCGLLLHALPAALTRGAVRLIPHTDEEEATDKMAAGLVLFPLCWAVEAWLVQRFGSHAALGMFLLLLVPAGLCAAWWLDGVKRVRREMAALLHVLQDRDFPQRCRGMRQELLAEIDELSRGIPPLDNGIARRI